MRELNASRLTLHQKSNARSVHEIDIFQIQFGYVSGLLDFRVQLSMVLLVYPAAQLQDYGPSIVHALNSQHSWCASQATSA